MLPWPYNNHQGYSTVAVPRAIRPRYSLASALIYHGLASDPVSLANIQQKYVVNQR